MKILKFNEVSNISEKKLVDYKTSDLRKVWKELRKKALKECNICLKKDNPNCGTLMSIDASDSEIAKYLDKQEAKTFIKLSKYLDKVDGYKINANEYKIDSKDIDIIINLGNIKVNEMYFRGGISDNPLYNEIRNKYYELKVKPTSIEDIINFLTKNGYEITK